jgi:hypothetical protein
MHDNIFYDMIVQFNVQQRLKYATFALKVCWILTIFSILCYECFLNCDFVSVQHKFVHFSYFVSTTLIH